MINSVPATVNAASRQVTLRHPNSIPATVLRKSVQRVDTPPDTMGSMPTLGGMGVLSSEDESKIDWTVIGEARVLIAEQFQTAELSDRMDSIGAPTPQQRAMIECLANPGAVGYFECKLQDIVILTPGAMVGLAFEVVAVEGNINIPPFTQSYILSPRDELSSIPGIASVNPRP